jgi:FAD/FMN-containing dehydrogenase
VSDEYQSWGRYPRLTQRVLSVSRAEELPPKIAGPYLPRGNGRSYGDSCLAPETGTLVDVRKLDDDLAFDQATGVLRCGAGTVIGDIQERSLALGWSLPVSPGTRFVTVGGAIANDVHGKNHHRRGSFGNHVLGFELVRSTGERLACSNGENLPLFCATIGGLGLTGFVTRADLQLVRVASAMVDVESIRLTGIEEFAALSMESDAAYEYTVAWIDCLATPPRGIFTRANHLATRADGERTPARRRFTMPFTPPLSLVGRASLKLFNELYYHRPIRRRQVAHVMDHLYPLDAIGHWNRIYGPRGFQQYQCVVPAVDAPAIVAEMLSAVARDGAGSFLGVLKRFGDIPARGLLSFPRPGWTLALDFPMRGEKTIALFQQLDEMVLRAGGALYPAKDAHMSARTFQRAYPQWRELEARRDPQIRSAFWERGSS